MEHTTIKIAGMTCGGCVASVNRALKNIQGVKDVNVSLEEKRAEVEFDPTATTIGQLEHAVQESGYDVIK